MIEHATLTSLALAGEFFTTSATWEAQQWNTQKNKKIIYGMGETFANHISEKRILIPKYMRNSYNSIAKQQQKQENNLKNGQKDLK